MGKVCVQAQADARGGLVCYNTFSTTDESQWKPLWALRNGILENFPDTPDP